ncbi:MAG: hypothetical protein ABIT37_01615 [Luteolibacter sp.]
MSIAAEKVTKINLSKREGVEWEVEFDIETNKVTGSAVYTDDFEGWMARAPSGKSSFPDIPALILRKIKGIREEGLKVKVLLSYEANDPEASYPGRDKGKIQRYTVEPSSGEEPLLTFHKLKDLVNSSKEAIAELLASGRAPADFAKATAAIGADPLALFAVDKIRDGRETYLHAGIMWVERFQTKKLSDLECDKFFTIIDAGDVPGGPPPLADGATWLYVPGTATPNADGESWEMERKWQASDRGGWDTWLYGTETTPDP